MTCGNAYSVFDLRQGDVVGGAYNALSSSHRNCYACIVLQYDTRNTVLTHDDLI